MSHCEKVTLIKFHQVFTIGLLLLSANCQTIENPFDASGDNEKVENDTDTTNTDTTDVDKGMPSIKQHPTSLAVTEGDLAVFNVRAGGEALTYQWQRNEADIYNATSNVFAIAKPRLADNASRFRCVVCNEAGCDTSNSGLLTVNVKVVDTIPPRIGFVGKDTVVIVQGDAFVDNYNVSDNVDRNLKEKVKVTGSVNTSKIGIYPLTYTVADSAGNSTTALRVVIVVKWTDGTPDKPVIKILGKNPDTVMVLSKETYVDGGATAMSASSGDLTSLILTSGNVDMRIPGRYEINYRVNNGYTTTADGAVTRTVLVLRDSTNPDMFKRYSVPLPIALPSTDLKYSRFEIDGNGPDLSSISEIDFTWNFSQYVKNFMMTIKYTASPYMKSMVGSSYNFLESPSITLKGTEIAGLDGEFYVAVNDKELYFVRKNGAFAIICRE